MMTTQRCLICDIPTKKLCSSCKSVFYCNQEHQQKDWRSHKEYCLKVKAAGANTFDAILFAVNETKPRLVKIPWELSSEDEGVDEDDSTQFHKLDTDVWFKHPNKFVRTMSIQQWGINGPKLAHGICFYYDDNFVINGSPLNRCIMDITGGRAGHRWCGNVLALRMKDPRPCDLRKSVDMEEDLRPLVKYFIEF